MVEISTSILNVKEEDIIPTIYKLETAHTDYYHIDVMDGEFVQDNTNERMLSFCEHIKQISNIPLDVHLMVKDVESYIDSYLVFEPNIITFHIEAMKDKEQTMKVIQKIKENHCKVGISIKPNTTIEDIKEFLPYIHMILIMTVEPGKGGQAFMEEMLEKAKELVKYMQESKLEIDIEIDGGVNQENCEIAKKAGVNIMVAGSAIIKSEDYQKTITELKK